MQKIVPNLWFKGNAQEAVDFYLSVFPDSKMISTVHYPMDGLADFQKDFAGKVLTIEFELRGERFVAINAGPEFTFTEAVSFLIECADQAEIDYYWNALTTNGGEESQCGWLKDKYGLSWQVAPEGIDAVVQQPKLFARLLEMKKINIAELMAE